MTRLEWMVDDAGVLNTHEPCRSQPLRTCESPIVSLDVEFARTFTWARVAAKILDAALS